MKVTTKFFGDMEIEEKDIMNFKEGIPGFKEYVRYALIHEAGTDFSYLQSVDNQYLCLIVVPPALIVGNYDIEISDDCVEKLELSNPDDAIIYIILNIPEDIRSMTANLKAPIIINRKNGNGKQEILDDERYAIRHRVIKEADASC